MASALRIPISRPIPPPAVDAPRRRDELGRDELDRFYYSAWLLAPDEPDRIERCIRAASAVVGPVAFLAFTGAVFFITL